MATGEPRLSLQVDDPESSRLGSISPTDKQMIQIWIRAHLPLRLTDHA